MCVHFLQTIAITTFETEISNFFAIDFSNTSYAKEPKYRVLNIYWIDFKIVQTLFIIAFMLQISKILILKHDVAKLKMDEV